MSTQAPAVNSVTLVGNLTSSPELRSLPDGRSVCDMRLAVNDQREQPPLFIDVATFGAAAEACAKYLARGARDRRNRTPRVPRMEVRGRHHTLQALGRRAGPLRQAPERRSVG
jgi:Single-strand binding protein family